MDMRIVIKSMLQVQHTNRPDCEQLLEMPQIKKRINKYFSQNQTVSDTSGFGANSTMNSELLKTIKYSNNFLNMRLPAANYPKVSYATLPSAANPKGGKSR